MLNRYANDSLSFRLSRVYWVPVLLMLVLFDGFLSSAQAARQRNCSVNPTYSIQILSTTGEKGSVSKYLLDYIEKQIQYVSNSFHHSFKEVQASESPGLELVFIDVASLPASSMTSIKPGVQKGLEIISSLNRENYGKLPYKVQSPWLKAVKLEDSYNKCRFKFFFIWNVGQLIADQANLQGAITQPITDNFIKKYKSIDDLSKLYEAGDRESQHYPPELYWLFSNVEKIKASPEKQFTEKLSGVMEKIQAESINILPMLTDPIISELLSNESSDLLDYRDAILTYKDIKSTITGNVLNFKIDISGSNSYRKETYE